jgi:hypothetical protein
MRGADGGPARYSAFGVIDELRWKGERIQSIDSLSSPDLIPPITLIKEGRAIWLRE